MKLVLFFILSSQSNYLGAIEIDKAGSGDAWRHG